MLSELLKPPADFQPDGVDFWPAIEDQITLIEQRRDQLARALKFYKGTERDYHVLTRELAILRGVVHSLKAIQTVEAIEAAGNADDPVPQSQGLNTNLS